MYFTEITNGKITCKGEGDFKTADQVEISETIFNALTNLPADYTEKDGKITAVVPAPEPEPIPYMPSLEERVASAESALNVLMGVV